MPARNWWEINKWGPLGPPQPSQGLSYNGQWTAVRGTSVVGNSPAREHYSQARHQQAEHDEEQEQVRQFVARTSLSSQSCYHLYISNDWPENTCLTKKKRYQERLWLMVNIFLVYHILCQTYSSSIIIFSLILGNVPWFRDIVNWELST